MPRPGPNVTSDADTQPGSDSLFPTGFSGGGALVRPGSVGTGELADGSVASADLNLASVATALAARTEFTGTYASPAGAWSAGTYSINQVVTYNGNTYRSLVGGNTATPGTDPAKWESWGGGGGGGAAETVSTVASSGAGVTVPAPSTATISRVTLTANCTFTFPTATAGASFTLILTQDGTGSRTAAWPAAAKWPSGIAPTLSTGAGKVDWLTFTCADGSTWAGFLAGSDIR